LWQNTEHYKPDQSLSFITCNLHRIAANITLLKCTYHFLNCYSTYIICRQRYHVFHMMNLLVQLN